MSVVNFLVAVLVVVIKVAIFVAYFKILRGGK